MILLITVSWLGRFPPGRDFFVCGFQFEGVDCCGDAEETGKWSSGWLFAIHYDSHPTDHNWLKIG